MKNLKDIFVNKKELLPTSMPGAPNFYSKCFLFVRSTENVNAPGELVSELFRETFYDNYSSLVRPNGSRLEPNCQDLTNTDSSLYSSYTEGEKAVLEIIRGKSKRDRKKTLFVYTPAYPQLMRNSWLRKKHGRNVRGHFLGGVLAQALHSKNDKKINEEIVKLGSLLFKSCIGNFSHGNIVDSELLDALRNTSTVPKNECFENIDDVALKLRDFIIQNQDGEEYNNYQVYNLPTEYANKDILPRVAYNDFTAILNLESSLPRVEWINYLSNYLRVIVPVWVLTSTKATSMIYDALIEIIDNSIIIDKVVFLDSFVKRNQKIFTCSESPNSGGEQIIKDYGVKRIKLSLLFYILENTLPEAIFKKHLDIEACSSDRIGLFDFFEKILVYKEKIKDFVSLDSHLSIDQYLSRQAESYMGYKDPLNTSILKNMSELLRVLREPETGFDSGGLLIPKKNGRQLTGYVVFPQPALIRLFTFLACNKKTNEKIMIKDLIDHFEAYGIDFSRSNEARENLSKSLMQLGLLEGSPDAGANAIIGSPLKKTKHHVSN
jgi:hypothetical protein